MRFAEVDGTTILDARVIIPSSGAWCASVTLDKEVEIAPSVTLTIADLSLKGSPVWPAIPYQGRTRVRLVGGKGGWSKVVGPKGYNIAAGVKLSLVLGDLAREVGETVAVGSDRVLGEHYTRERDLASLHLSSLVPGAWWIDPDGTTRTGARPSSPIGSPFTIVDFDGARRVAMVATETPSDFVPGRTFRGPTLSATITINAVTHIIAKGALRSEVMAS